MTIIKTLGLVSSILLTMSAHAYTLEPTTPVNIQLIQQQVKHDISVTLSQLKVVLPVASNTKLLAAQTMQKSNVMLAKQTEAKIADVAE